MSADDEEEGRKLFKEIFGSADPISGPDDPRIAQVMPMLLAIGGHGGMGTRVAADGQVDFHDGPKIVLPKGMTYEEALKTLQRHRDDAETRTSWSREFKYRLDDGAHAAHLVLQRMFGMTMGEARHVDGLFGTHVIPAETRDIAVAFNQRVQVPWGTVTLPRLPGLELLFEARQNDEYGAVFGLYALGPRKYKDEVEAIFDAVEEELRTNSIYRGQALNGSNKLEFIDLSAFNPEEIVFSAPVQRALEAKLWSVLRYTEAVRQQGVPLKRAVLLYGPYGTGKTSAGTITGQIATQNGWTYLRAGSGDNIEDVLRTARLYQRAVAFFEDIDRAGDVDGDGLAKLLDAFDGVTTKGGELVVVMTTNRQEGIPKGMFRPGRLDAVIRIAELDRDGTERLIKALVPAGKLSADVDYDKVFTAMEGYLPAFIREAVNSALLYAVDRLRGGQDYVITTEDLVAAAESLRDQFVAHQAANEGLREPTLNRAMTETIQGALHGGVLQIPGWGRAKILLDGTQADED